MVIKNDRNYDVTKEVEYDECEDEYKDEDEYEDEDEDEYEDEDEDEKEKEEEEEGKDLKQKIAELSAKMEKFNLAEYLALLNNPRRFLMINFLAGLARGFGIALGITVLGALALYILQWLVVLNLPLIGDFIAELVRIVLTHL